MRAERPATVPVAWRRRRGGGLGLGRGGRCGGGLVKSATVIVTRTGRPLGTLGTLAAGWQVLLRPPLPQHVPTCFLRTVWRWGFHFFMTAASISRLCLRSRLASAAFSAREKWTSR